MIFRIQVTPVGVGGQHTVHTGRGGEFSLMVHCNTMLLKSSAFCNNKVVDLHLVMYKHKSLNDVS